MAAINFPDSPSNGDTHVVGGVTYTYNSTETKWKTTINSNAFLPLTGGTLSGNLNMGTNDLTVGDVTASGTASLSGLTYPTSDGTAGQYLQTDGNGALSFQTVTDTTGWTYDSTGTSLTGASVTVDSIPSDAQAIHIVIDGLSVSSAVEWDILVGTSSGDTTSGYDFIAGYTGATTDQRGSVTDAFTTKGTNSATYVHYAIMKLERGDANGNTWFAQYWGRITGESRIYYMNGIVNAGGTLDRVTISAPTGTLDAGTVYVHYRVE